MQAKNTDFEQKKYCLNCKKEIIVNDYTSVKAIEPTFEPSSQLCVHSIYKQYTALLCSQHDWICVQCKSH